MKTYTICVLLVTYLLAGCSTLSKPVSEDDPFESVNRKVFAFNAYADDWVLKPVAQGYRAVVPDPVKNGVSNFVGNLSDIPNAANNFLQGKVEDGFASVSRFVLNSTYGVLGVFDVAKTTGIEQKPEDLGQTLAVWGVPSGPYIVLPFFGPSNVRDGAADLALAVAEVDEAELFFSDDETLAIGALAVIDLRESLLDTDDVRKAAAVDLYNSTKNGYIQFRTRSITGKDFAQSDEAIAEENELFEEETEFSDEDLFNN